MDTLKVQFPRNKLKKKIAKRVKMWVIIRRKCSEVWTIITKMMKKRISTYTRKEIGF